MAIQSILGKYGANVQEAWSWLLPTVMPTLSLIIGVLILDATSNRVPDKKVEPFLFNLTFAISVLYLALVTVTVLVQPFTGLSSLKLMGLSNLWLGPLQGLASAAIGVFFLKAGRGK